MRKPLIWTALLTVAIVPIVAAANSPQLAWRDPVYIFAGFAGIIAMVLLLIQPLLAGRQVKLHRAMGTLLVIAIIGHVGGLWVTSPPDVVDALLFRSPTQFSVWGMLAMWGVFATAAFAFWRKRLRPRIWRRGHAALAILIVSGSVLHALLIEGTMEPWSKATLCIVVIAVTAKVIIDKRIFAKRTPR